MDIKTAIHTLNNHLMVVLGNLELLNAEITDPEMRVSIDDAMSATEKAIEVVAAVREAQVR